MEILNKESEWFLPESLVPYWVCRQYQSAHVSYTDRRVSRAMVLTGTIHRTSSWCPAKQLTHQEHFRDCETSTLSFEFRDLSEHKSIKIIIESFMSIFPKVLVLLRTCDFEFEKMKVCVNCDVSRHKYFGD